ncbi:glycosyltransferase family 61 protein [Pseudomonas asiatica]|uniref:glycosyltransferase family 61 protein n=1 Tax=Pseudomonas asiatica TaxID=2219225 RepID=UPI0023667672|nr:glycosyltransferase family 61 protein [Pseudomonas asiatica]MDD1982350.1 glycosyltransferase family 61 protein [Pseudomonas asiatica]
MLDTINGIESAVTSKFRASLKVLFPEMELPNSRHPFHADDSNDHRIVQWHKAHPSKFSIGCFFSGDIVVSGMGSLWRDNKLVVEPLLMPLYWRNRIFENSFSDPASEVNLPIREIEETCICAIGWGFEIYGHFLIEMLPRILTAIKILKQEGVTPKVLLRSDSPRWMKSIIESYLLDEGSVITFDPKTERVKLTNGVYPTYPYYAHGFHPEVKGLIESIEGLPDHAPAKTGNYFVSRASMPFSKTRRTCTNEELLADIAKTEFGLTVITPESMTWAEQVNIFRSAKSVVGLSGSALHTSLFSNEDFLIGVIGLVNPVQTHIAALRQHRMAYQITGFNIAHYYDVPVDPFRKMLEKIVNR